MLHYLTIGEDTGTVNFSRPAQPEIGTSYTRPGALPRRAGNGSSGSGPGSAQASGANTPRSAEVNHASAQTPPQPKKWRRCPICWDAVYARDLKAVKWWDPREEARKTAGAPDDSFRSTEGHDHMSMRLMERPQITTLALPQSDSWPGTSDDDLTPPHAAPWHFQPDVLPFAKFMLATPALIEESLNEDLSQLEVERITLETMPGGKDAASLMFVQAAREKVLEQIEKARAECDTPGVRNAIARKQNQMQRFEEELEVRAARGRKEPPQENPPSEDSIGEDSKVEGEDAAAGQADENVADFLAFQSRSQGGQAQAAPQSEGETATSSHPRREFKPRRNVNPPSPSSSSYFFYQAASGQNIFLHPLDIKVLHSKYGSYSAFPKTIHVKVSGADEGSMNEDLRRRCKYLTHIPTAADVVFIEVDWEAANAEGADMKTLQLDSETLKPYLTALRQRKNRRRDRGRKEDRAKLKADEEAASAESRVKQIAPSQEYKQLALQQWKAGEAGSLGSAQLSSSFGSVSSTQSPSFREAALVGAERDFPVHPGGPLEEFPAVPSTSGESQPTAIPQAANGKTVWGTPAARTAFTEALQRGQRSGEDEMWAKDVDDAWLELEEDFLLGATPGGRRNTGAVKEGRGLNKQPRSGVATPKTPLLSKSPKEDPYTSAPGARQTSSNEDEQPGEGSNTPTRPAGRPKKAKKKLILTSGGRGTA